MDPITLASGDATAIAVGGAGSLRLLGGWQLTVGAQRIHPRFREQRLLAALALKGRGQRCYIASTLWPEATERHARGSLRASIWSMQHQQSGVLAYDNHTIGLGDAIATDVASFTSACAAVDEHRPGHRIDDGFGFTGVLDVLTSGELLPGWYDEWLMEEREFLRGRQQASLVAYARITLRETRPELAERAASAATRIDPLDEQANELRILANLALGRTTEAYRLFLAFRARLHDELGVEPSERFRAIVPPLRDSARLR